MIEQRRGIAVSPSQLTQVGERSQVRRISRKPDADVEEPIEFAGVSAAKGDGEVVEHPVDDRPCRDRIEIARMKGCVRSVDRAEPGDAGVVADPYSRVKRIDEPIRISVLANEKVSGHTDADEIDPHPTGYLDQDHRKRDRHADPASDDLVQVAVSRIVVVHAITDESLVDEHVSDEPIHIRIRAAARDGVQRVQSERGVGGGARARLREQKQGFVERDVVVAQQDVGEAVRGGHDSTVANYCESVPTIHPYLDVGSPIAFAHRGGAEVHPENTELAFQHAIDLGYTHLESDVHVTRDGVAIAFHDGELDRVTDRQGTIAELEWAQVSEARVDGTEPIMTLDDLFEAFPSARLNLDPKHGAAVEPLAEAILRHDAVNRVMVGAFSDRRIAQVRDRVGEGLAVSAGPRQTAALMLRSRGVPMPTQWFHAVQVPRSMKGVPVVTERFVAHLHRQGTQVHVWTINEPDAMHRLLDLGVDGLMTDRPAVLRDVLIERGVWRGPPPESPAG